MIFRSISPGFATVWIALSLAIPARADTTAVHTVLIHGTPSGKQTTTTGADGRITVDFSYRDNGRGPDVREEILLAPDGTQRSHRLTGKSTFGAPIDESYSVEAGKAQWTSQADRGDADLPRPAVYFPVGESSGESLAVLVRALQRQPAGRLAAVPAGELALQPLTEASLGDKSRSQAVRLYAITGLGFAPTYVWMTEGATKPAQSRLFAIVQPGWYRLVAAGWEKAGADLERLQMRGPEQVARDHGPPSGPPPAGPAAHPQRARVRRREGQAAAGPRRLRLPGPHRRPLRPGRRARPGTSVGTSVIDGQGHTLLPACSTCTPTRTPGAAVLQMAGGRDHRARHGQRQRRAGQSSSPASTPARAVGPRIVPAGFIEGESEHAAKHGFVVEDIGRRQAGHRLVRPARLPADQDLQLLPPRVGQRDRRPTPTSAACASAGTCPPSCGPRRWWSMGYDEIQHINQVMLNFLVKPQDDTRTLLRFYLVGDKAQELDLRLRPRAAVHRAAQEHGDRRRSDAGGVRGLQAAAGRAAPQPTPPWPTTSRSSRSGRCAPTRWTSPTTNAARFRAPRSTRWRRSSARMHEAGVPMVAGTDDLAGFTLHRELELYVKAGIPAAEALRIATWNGARVHAHARSAGLDHAGQAGRPGAGRRRSHHQHRRSPPGPAGDEGGRRLLPGEIYPEVGVKPFAPPLDIARAALDP